MSFTIGPAIVGPSTVLQGNQPLRAVWRRSGTATAQEVFSVGLYDTSLNTLYERLDAALRGAYLVRGSAPTFTEDTITLDVVTVATSILPSGLTVSRVAQLADGLVPGLALVNLNGRARTPSEQQRAAERDVAATAGQAVADTSSVGAWLETLGDRAKLILAAVVIVVVIAGAVYFLPRPTGAKKST